MVKMSGNKTGNITILGPVSNRINKGNTDIKLYIVLLVIGLRKLF